MGIIDKMNPAAGFSDFISEFRKPTPYRWPILGVSMLMTFTLLYQIMGETMIGPPARPDVTYITSFADDRTEEEIIASNIENQKTQDAIDALIEENEEAKRELYRTLGRASGMDVEAIEREAAKERAREEAAENARKMEIRRRAGLLDDPVETPKD